MSKKVFVLVHDYWRQRCRSFVEPPYDELFFLTPIMIIISGGARIPWTVPHNEPAWND